MNSKNPTDSTEKLDLSRLPAHVAIIMDGNGRWAQKKLMNRVTGHEKGAETVRMVVKTCRELGVNVLTLYAFSTENWQRPKLEVSALMTLLRKFIEQETPEMLKTGIRLKAIGELEMLPDSVLSPLKESMEKTKDNKGMILNLALSYGGRGEITRALRRISEEVRIGSIDSSSVTEETISSYLDTNGMPDPDILIRTSGEQRISNFLLWQVAYAEMFFTKTLWPDFTRDEFIDILAEYQKRNRTFGKVT